MCNKAMIEEVDDYVDGNVTKRRPDCEEQNHDGKCQYYEERGPMTFWDKFFMRWPWKNQED